MTAVCAAVAVVPLVVRGNVPGQEIEYPMALVILGGLVTSTAMTLFPLPSLHGAWCPACGGRSYWRCFGDGQL